MSLALPSALAPFDARTTLASLSFAAAALLFAAGCSPGGSGPGAFLGEIVPIDDEPGDVQGDGQPDAFALVYPSAYGFGSIGQPFAPLTPMASVPASSFAISPSLPEGLSISSVTGAITGTPLASAPLTLHTVTAQSATGGAQAEVLVEVAGRPRFAYAANAADSTISIFTVDAVSGRLRHRGYHGQSGFARQPTEIAIHPSGSFLYTANDATDSVAVLRIDPQDGTLDEVAAEPVGPGQRCLAIHPAGGHLYLVSSVTSTLRVYRIDPEDGTLTQVGPNIPTPPDPTCLLMAPSGRFLLTIHETAGVVTSYRIDPGTGLPQVSVELSLGFLSRPIGGAIGAMSRHAYVTLAGLESVLSISIDPLTAVLEAVETRATELLPGPLVLHPSGRFGYVLNGESRERETPSVSVYPIDVVSGAIFEPVHEPLDEPAVALVLDPPGANAYLVETAETRVRRCSVDPEDGRLVALETVRTRLEPVGVAFTAGDLPLRARASRLYVASAQLRELWTYAVDPITGRPSALGPPLDTVGEALAVAVDPFLRYLWVVDVTAGKERLVVHALDAEGLPSFLHETLFGMRPSAVTAEPSGRFVYVASDDAQNVVFTFRIQPDGSLAILSFDPVGFSPTAVVADPTGRFLYVVNSGARQPGDQGSFSSFAIDPESGLLSPVLPAGLAGGGPTTLAFSPGGERAYSTFANTDIAATYDLVAATGQIDIVLHATMTGPDPRDVVITPTGLFAYVAFHGLPGVGGVELFDVRESDGVLFNSQTGELSSRAVFLAGLSPLALGLDPGGGTLWVLNRGSATLTTFAADVFNGTLNAIDLDATPFDPSVLALGIAVE